MKRFLSIILSVVMLAASTVYAAPTAVVPENAEEQVVSEIPVEEMEQVAQVEADLAAEVAADVRVFEFGVTDFYEDMSDATHNGVNSATVTDNGDGTVTLTSSASNAWPQFYANRSENYTLTSGRIYTFYVDAVSFGSNANDGNKIEYYRPMIQNSSGAAIAFNSDINYNAEVGLTITDDISGTDPGKNRFATDKPYRQFKVKNGSTSYTIKSIGISMYNTSSTVNFNITMSGIGIFSKPTATETAPTPVYSGNTAAVTYANGLHDEVKAALQVAGAIPGVTGVAIDGNTVTYTIETGKNVVIPSLVNAANDAVYPEQTLRIDVNVHALEFGVTDFYNDLSNATASGANTTVSINSENGNVTFATTGDGGVFRQIISNYNYSLTPNREYTYYVDFVEFGEGTGAENYRPMMNGVNLSSSTNLDGNTKYKVTDDLATSGDGYQRFDVNKPYRKFVLKSGVSSFAVSNVGLCIYYTAARNDSATLSGIAMYSKPTAEEAKPTPEYSGNTATVTYTNGLHDEVKMALQAVAIDGVTAVAINGSTVTYTLEKGKDAVIPALVNGTNTEVYPEQTLSLPTVDPYTVWFGKKLFLEDFETKTSFTSPESKVSVQVVDREDGTGKAFKISSNGSFTSWPSISVDSTAISLDAENYDYSFFVEYLNSNKFTDVNKYPIRARFGKDGTLYLTKKVYNAAGDNYFDDVNFMESFGGKNYHFESTETNVNITSGVTSITPSIFLNAYEGNLGERWITIDNFGIYVKPKAEATATEPVYSCPTNQFSITYGEGIYSATLDALLDNPTLIDGVTAISKTTSENSVTLTYTYDQNVSDIEIPSFINAEENKTYPAQTVEIIVFPKNVEKGIRTNVKNYGMGVRAVARVSQYARETYGDDKVEYGTLVTLDEMLSNNDLTAYDLTFDTQAKQDTYENRLLVISEASYKGDGKTNKLTIDGEYESYAAAFVGIPQTAENYKKNLVFRHYVKYTVNDVTYIVYGEPLAISPYSVATEILESSEDKTTEIAVYCQGIIDFCDGKSNAVTEA